MPTQTVHWWADLLATETPLQGFPRSNRGVGV